MGSVQAAEILGEASLDKDPALFLHELPGRLGTVISELPALLDQVVDAAGLVIGQGVAFGPPAQPCQARTKIGQR